VEVLTVWPFDRWTERREASYADEVVQLIQARAAGETVDARTLAVVEACSGLWERAVASAAVKPMSAALRGVTTPCLALIGRGLAYRGEFVGAIEVSDAGLTVLAAASWEVHGKGPDPMGWRYRVDLGGPDGTVTRELVSDAVLHVRLSDPKSPWRGRSPLTRSKATADLAGKIEDSLDRESRIPPTRIAPVPGTNEQNKDYADGLRKGGIMATWLGTGVGGDQIASNRWSPAKMGPEPDEVVHALRTQTGHDVCNAYGVPPTLFHPSGDGAGQREAWRRFWLGTVAPLGALIESELRAKLDPAAMVSFEALAAADEDGRSRAVSRRATAFKTFMDAGIERDEALRLAGLGDG